VAEALLRVQQVHTYHGESYVLQGVDVAVPEGKVAVLLGRNGMGKTTLIRSITGVTPARRGEIWFRDHRIDGLPPYEIARLGIAVVPQGRRIFGSLTVKENLDIPAWVQTSRRPDVGPKRDAWTMERIFEQFPNLRARLPNRAGSLSGGEQQMLAIARALIANPTLLLMDEPSEGLAPLIVEEIAGIVARLKARGQSILLVEQDFDFALDVADIVYVMMNGQIVYAGPLTDPREQELVRTLHLGL
jgi:branched-chain amino acid transport system ATP-binding protein